MKDYYKILEIAPDAPQGLIREQYRFLVQAWHPDKFQNFAQKSKAEEKIKEINEAYQALSNPDNRAEYDRNIYYAHSRQGRNHRENTGQRQSEDERQKKEENRRRAKEEQLKKDRENRERAEEKKRRSEDERRQRINKIEEEISLIKQEINQLYKELPKMPSPLLGILLYCAAFYLPYYSTSENTGLFLILSAIFIGIGTVLFVDRNKFYREKYKPVFDEIEKRKRHVQQLIRESP